MKLIMDTNWCYLDFANINIAFMGSTPSYSAI